MTDSNATELLRKMLDERGVEWKAGFENVTWVGDWCFVEYDNGKLAATCEPTLTLEQAVAVTLGAGECENEKLRGQIETLVAYVESDGTKYYVDDEGNQHFDHAATLGAMDTCGGEGE